MKHCTNCGERIVEAQQFCRGCGTELAEGRQRRFDPRYLIYIGLFSVLIGVMVVMAGGFIDSKTVAFAGSLFAVLSFGVMLTGAILSDTGRRRRKSKAESLNLQNEPPTLEKADTTNRLPPIAAKDHFPPSVTEETTTKLRVKQ